jgi:hypothetical protein
MKKYVALILLFATNLSLFSQNQFVLSSPTQQLKAAVDIEENCAKINLSTSSSEVIQVSTLDFDLSKDIIEGDWEVINQQYRSQNQTWKPIYGEKSEIPDSYNELTLTFSSTGNNKQVDLIIRLYDEGLAFKYKFDSTDFWSSVLTKEETSFIFPTNSNLWASSNAQGLYSKTTISELKGEVDRPLVIEVKNDLYVAIGEAGLVDFARMKLKNGSNNNTYQVNSALTGSVALDKANYASPWRYVMVADSPGGLLEQNYLVLNLNEPNQIKNTAWIKPGKVLREVTLTTQGAKSCIDFASNNQIEYVEFDAGWYGNEYDKKSDASTVTLDEKRSKGPFDLPYIIEYAKERGVGILLYVNMNALNKQIDQVLPLYKKWGIKGVKYGFVNVGNQQWTSWLHHAVRLAAKYELMVDIHDEYRPTGYSRTYPNLLTQEGIRGDEESPSVQQSIYTIFTRMIAGAGDNTNCFFAPRVVDKMGGKAAQMAKAIMIYSPWQFIYWYDRPEGSPRKALGAGSAETVIIEDQSTQFYNTLPTVWDDTKVLSGTMGEEATIARRSGNNWYVGTLNAASKREQTLNLDFLDPQASYTVMIYTQNAKELKKNKVNCKQIKLGDDRELKITLEQNSGSALVICKDVY